MVGIKNRMRLCTAFAALASVVLLAGCAGGSTSGGHAQSQSSLPRGVADKLAAQSESIAESAEAGDECGAAHEADALHDAAEAAINGGQIPVAYQDELETAVTDLQNALNCPPPPEDENAGENQGKNEDEGKKKGHDKDGGGETGDTGVTITTDTLAVTTGDGG